MTDAIAYNDRMTFRCPADLLELVDQAARARGSKPTEWVRQALQTALRLDGFDPAPTIGANGGTQTYTQQRSDLPNVAPTATFNGTQQTWNLTANNVSGGETGGVGGGGGNWYGGQASNATVTVTPSGSVTVQSLNGGVTQTAMDNMPPALVMPYILRVI